MINFRIHYLGKHSMCRPQLLPGHLSWTHQVNSKQGSQIQRVHLVTVPAECYWKLSSDVKKNWHSAYLFSKDAMTPILFSKEGRLVKYLCEGREEGLSECCSLGWVVTASEAEEHGASCLLSFRQPIGGWNDCCELIVTSHTWTEIKLNPT